MRSDDVGNTHGTSSAVAVDGTSITASGIISTSSDVDVWSFTTDAGAVSITVEPFDTGDIYRGNNLDVRLIIQSSSSSVVTDQDSQIDVAETWSGTLSAGTYYIHVQSGTSNNYPTYGSLGQYTISGTVAVASGSDCPALSLANPPYFHDCDGGPDSSQCTVTCAATYYGDSSTYTCTAGAYGGSLPSCTGTKTMEWLAVSFACILLLL